MEKEQIIKALGEEIKLADYVGNGVKTTLFKNTIALIKELTEENERLKAEVSVKKKLLDKCVDLDDMVKADTVREFANRLKAVCWSCIMTPSTIDRIAKEILEE